MSECYIDTALLPAGAFSCEPRIRKVGKRRWRLEDDLVYRARDGRLFIIPAGTETDGASVPRFVWWLYPPIGDAYDRAAFLHDFLYQHVELFEGSDHGHMSRGEADGLFLEAMEVDGFRWTGRQTVHKAVRAGGWRAWRKHRKAALKAAGAAS